MNRSVPNDINGRTMQVGDFLIYTLERDGGLNFGFITEFASTPRGNLKLRIAHSDIHGVLIKSTNWNRASRNYEQTDVDYKTWLNYTGSHRFMVTDPR